MHGLRISTSAPETWSSWWNRCCNFTWWVFTEQCVRVCMQCACIWISVILFISECLKFVKCSESQTCVVANFRKITCDVLNVPATAFWSLKTVAHSESYLFVCFMRCVCRRLFVEWLCLWIFLYQSASDGLIQPMAAIWNKTIFFVCRSSPLT